MEKKNPSFEMNINGDNFYYHLFLEDDNKEEEEKPTTYPACLEKDNNSCQKNIKNTRIDRDIFFNDNSSMRFDTLKKEEHTFFSKFPLIDESISLPIREVNKGIKIGNISNLYKWRRNREKDVLEVNSPNKNYQGINRENNNTYIKKIFNSQNEEKTEHKKTNEKINSISQKTKKKLDIYNYNLSHSENEQCSKETEDQLVFDDDRFSPFFQDDTKCFKNTELAFFINKSSIYL